MPDLPHEVEARRRRIDQILKVCDCQQITFVGPGQYSGDTLYECEDVIFTFQRHGHGGEFLSLRGRNWKGDSIDAESVPIALGLIDRVQYAALYDAKPFKGARYEEQVAALRVHGIAEICGLLASISSETAWTRIKEWRNWNSERVHTLWLARQGKTS